MIDNKIEKHVFNQTPNKRYSDLGQASNYFVHVKSRKYNLLVSSVNTGVMLFIQNNHKYY